MLYGSDREAMPRSSSVRICHRHCNLWGMSEENRKHARLMQKANRLGQQDLLEIAAMKGMNVFTVPTAPANLISATGDSVGDDVTAMCSRSSGSSASGSNPNSVAATGAGGSTPSTPVAALTDLDGDAVSREQNPPDQEDHESE
jgi:hypothetical protein